MQTSLADGSLFCVIVGLVLLCRRTDCQVNPCKDQRFCVQLGRLSLLQNQCNSVQIKNLCPRSCKQCSVASPGRWKDWGAWSKCSKSCGEGKSTRGRTCSSPGTCIGKSQQSRSCNVRKCPKKPTVIAGLTGLFGPWSKWGAWSKCTKSCGKGQSTRSRKCRLTSFPWAVARTCPGKSKQSRSCNVQKCKVLRPGRWDEWSAWSKCTKTCGKGKSNRKRTCSKPRTCKGKSKASRVCNTQKCKVLRPGKWKKWSAWSKCTKTCGGGKSVRKRVCSKPKACNGKSQQSRTCNVHKCPVTVGKWGAWSDWTKCTKPCGGGQQKRQRSCLSSGICSGDKEQTRVCNAQPCGSGWLNWEKWGECSKACGSGIEMRRRVCKTPGRCSGNSEGTRPCNLRNCGYDSAYSSCSQPCGHGIQKKLQGSEYVTKHCDLGHCTAASCGVNEEQRYKNKFSCCKKTTKCSAPSTASVSTQRSSISYRRIIGGTNSAKGQFPWMVYFEHTYGKCGGSLLNNKYILTAAHCQQLDSGYLIPVTLYATYIGIVDISATNKISHPLIKSTPHPDYNYPFHDIGILQLKTPVAFGNYIKPVCLPHGEEVPHDTTCIAMGWGISLVGGFSGNNILQNVDLKVLDPDVCIHGYGGNPTDASLMPFLRERSGYICAGDLEKQKDSCNGDSGGPLVCQRCANCGWYVAGVVSYGPTPCANRKDPGVYTKVTQYEQWIYYVTGIIPQQQSC